MSGTAKDEIRHVELAGPGFYTAESITDRERRNILDITPSEQDPLVYWHQVAQDAIKTAEKEREKAKYAVAGRDKAEREFNGLTERLVHQAAANRSNMPLDLTRLIEMASTGKIDLSVSLYISAGKGGNNSDE